MNPIISERVAAIWDKNYIPQTPYVSQPQSDISVLNKKIDALVAEIEALGQGERQFTEQEKFELVKKAQQEYMFPNYLYSSIDQLEV